MKKRPLTIWLVSFLGFLTLPTYLLLQSWDLVLTSPLTWILSLSIPVSIGVFKVRRWGYFSFIAYALIGVSYLFYEYLQNPSDFNYSVLILVAASVAGVSFLLQKHISAPYFNPQIRWWERNPRYRVNLQAEFSVDGTPHEGTLLDLSLSGCFADLTHELISGDVITVKLTLLDYDFKSKAKVVWKHEGGYGLMFLDSDKSIKKMLNYLVEISGDHHTIIDQGVPAQ